MFSPGKFPLRFVFFGVIVVCLAGDLFVFKGPLRQVIERFASRDSNVVARVHNFRITRSQLERAVRERLWLEGETLESIAPESRKALRYAALDDLIEHELLRVRIKTDAPQLKAADGEIDERLRRLLGRFESKGEMETAMKSQGIASEPDLRGRLAARIQQEQFVESKIGPLVKVTDDEARKWFVENQKELMTPERAEARHIFIPTLDHPPEEAKAKLDAALADLTAKKKDFATLAKELSEDPATKETGGSLGWMTRSRLPVDFAAPVFSLALNKPALVRTRLGWHLVEVIGRKPAEARTFEQAKPEVLAALEAVKRRKAVAEYRDALRKSEAANIEVFHAKMEERVSAEK